MDGVKTFFAALAKAPFGGPDNSGMGRKGGREAIRDLIRRDQARQLDVAAIRAESIRGEESGEPRAFDANEFKDKMTDRHDRKAR
ncbi:ribbon-helix-helix domain-containing protein [Denitrobaculum tricleocarpae]|uniref:Type II toxin-antitoxin system ParD family antitoxin n=1 Tax=Denitrobaculum tricleocarpae TaxID=2591009 RepID=A0A545TY97_9PROT|nr:hypothetical protein [Denitrobaculum tricleocarpae]TQV82171.1 hypothetical protein FKG95_08090 [Denitrobaculum tricleocarpae]